MGKKVAQMLLFNLIFLGWVGPWVGEFVGFIVILTCMFSNPTYLVNRERPDVRSFLDSDVNMKWSFFSSPEWSSASKFVLAAGVLSVTDSSVLCGAPPRLILCRALPRRVPCTAPCRAVWYGSSAVVPYLVARVPCHAIP